MSGRYTLFELAELVGGEVRGDADATISGVNSIAAASADQITWVADARHVARLAKSQAGAVLVPTEIGETPMPALACGSVDRALSRILELFAPPVPRPESGIHPTAIIADTAKLDAHVAVGPYAVVGDRAVVGEATCLYAGVHVGPETRIGAHCVLWDHVVVRERCTIGDRVILHPHVVVGSDGFGFFFADGKHNKIPHGGRVVIQDDVEIGSGSTVDRSKVGETRIGRGTKIDNLVQVGHNVQVGAHCIIIAHSGIGGSTVLGNGVVLGGRVGLRDNIKLDDGAIVGACSCVSEDVPAGLAVSGIPAVDHSQQLRMWIATRRLPELAAEVRRIAKRLQDLEAAADHP